MSFNVHYACFACCFGSCFEDQKWSSDAVYRSMTESTQKDSALASGGQDGRSSRPFIGLGKDAGAGAYAATAAVGQSEA